MAKLKKKMIPAKEFLEEPAKFLNGLKETDGPLYITSRNKPAAVLVGAESYERDQKRLEGYERLVKDFEAPEKARMKAHAMVMAELSRRARKV